MHYADPPPELFRARDAVQLSAYGRTVDAFVVKASNDGCSLALQFDAMLGPWVAMMPVRFDGTGWYDLTGRAVELRKGNRDETTDD